MNCVVLLEDGLLQLRLALGGQGCVHLRHQLLLSLLAAAHIAYILVKQLF